MRPVYVVADNIFSPLGKNTRTNMEAMKQGRSGIQQHHSKWSPEPLYASLFSAEDKTGDESKTAFEKIVYRSAREAIQDAGVDLADKKTGFILSSTKGNISLLENQAVENYTENRISLNSSADIIANSLGIRAEPLVVS